MRGTDSSDQGRWRSEREVLGTATHTMAEGGDTITLRVKDQAGDEMRSSARAAYLTSRVCTGPPYDGTDATSIARYSSRFPLTKANLGRQPRKLLLLLLLFSLIAPSRPQQPTANPTPSPSINPTLKPTALPSRQPTAPSVAPSPRPSAPPSPQPTAIPSPNPTQPSPLPTPSPTASPTAPSPLPTSKPSPLPTLRPSSIPTPSPSAAPSASPTQPTANPTIRPSTLPTAYPTVTANFRKPSPAPTNPTATPTLRPTNPTGQPTRQPSRQPTSQPSRQPSRQPTSQPSGQPSGQPSVSPSKFATPVPTPYGSAFPTSHPTGRPSAINATLPQQEGDATYALPGQGAARAAYNRTCPDHHFLLGVRVLCVNPQLGAAQGTGSRTNQQDPNANTNTQPYLRIQATSTVNFHLTYTTDTPGFNANDDTPLQQPAVVSPLFINIPSFIPSSGDFSAFLVDQGGARAGEDYVDRLVGVALDGVPIYTALGVGGLDLLSSNGNLAQSSYPVDSCGGSFGPTPDGVRYHYRSIPACVLTPLGLNKRGYQDRRQVYVHSVHDLLDGFEGTAAEQGPQLLGWAISGHPIYSPLTARGLEHRDLDTCNGKFARNNAMTSAINAANAKYNSNQAQQQGGINYNDNADGMPNSFSGNAFTASSNNNNDLTYGFYTTTTFPYVLSCFGPGLHNLEEKKTTLEALPGRVSGRAFDACPGGYIPTPDRSTDGCTPCPGGKYSTASYHRPSAETGIVLTTLTGCAGTCPLGSYCPPASTKPSKCAAGRYGSSTGLADAGCSGACEAGYFCPAGSTSARAFPCGDASVYCPSGITDRITVDVGHYSVSETADERTPVSTQSAAAAANALDYDDTTRISQLPCGPGTYCLLGRRYLCPAGTYGEESFLSTALCTATCPVGSYCPIGATRPTLCPAGTYGSSTGQSDAACSGLCARGFWCPAGSTSSMQVPCKPGQYGAEEGLATEECSPMCELAGAPNGTDTHGTRFCEPRSCHAGYLCPLNSTSPTQKVCGGPGVYCPPHSVYPTPVTQGWYSIGNVSATGEMQQAVDAVTRISQSKCEPGYFCIKGIRTPCPKGSYGSTAGLYTATCSGPCAPGFICGLASTSAQQAPCGPGPQVFCPLGSGNYSVVPPGFYSVNGTLTTRSAMVPCPPGMWCQRGVKRACAAGRYSARGSSTSDCDGYCSPGYYCLAQSSSPTALPCPPGRYGSVGEANAACAGQCLEGYYCPESSTTPFQFECGNENQFCPAGSGSPTAVSRGFYSTGQNSTIRTAQRVCDVSVYYSTPPAARARLPICPSTTVN